MIFHSSQRHLSSYPPSKTPAKNPAPSIDRACSPKAGWTQVRDPLGAQPSHPRTGNNRSTSRSNCEDGKGGIHSAPSVGDILSRCPPSPASLHGLDFNNTGLGMLSGKLHQMEKTFLQSFKHFIWRGFSNSPNPDMLSAVFSYQRKVL